VQDTRVLARQLATDPRFSDYLTPERIDLLASPRRCTTSARSASRCALAQGGSVDTRGARGDAQHPAHGRDVIVNAALGVGVREDVTLGLAKEVVYTHHEKWDGTGYPEGLRNTEIPVAGRVMAVVDARRRHLAPSVSQGDVTRRSGRADCGGRARLRSAVVDAFVQVSPQMHRLSSLASGSLALKDESRPVTCGRPARDGRAITSTPAVDPTIDRGRRDTSSDAYFSLWIVMLP
jgi:hypothetical protein